MCYSDLPYLYTGRGFAERLLALRRHTAGRYEVMEYPVGDLLLRLGAPPGHPGRSTAADVGRARASRRTRPRCGQPGVTEEARLTSWSPRSCWPPFALLAAWFLAGVHPRRPWDALRLRGLTRRWC